MPRYRVVKKAFLWPAGEANCASSRRSSDLVGFTGAKYSRCALANRRRICRAGCGRSAWA